MSTFACEFRTENATEAAASTFLVNRGSNLATLGYKPQIQTTAGATYTCPYSPVVFIVL
jgi:hypothetical protein